MMMMYKNQTEAERDLFGHRIRETEMDKTDIKPVKLDFVGHFCLFLKL